MLKQANKKLSEDEKSFCDKDITEKEIETIIKSLKFNRSPGEDGIINEFCQTYWYLIKQELTFIIQYSFNKFTLPPSQYNAMISLLYKKGDREELSNWRPISLLNIDYKLVTKILAERLKTVLPNIIHQKGSVAGRNILEANKMLQDIIDLSERQNINSSIIFLDYQKTFDRVECRWTYKCLEAFNCGSKVRNWIQMIFNNAKTCIFTNGIRSRSMRQGCPFSPLLYIIKAEPLACAIRGNDKIIGFPSPYTYPDNDKPAEAKMVSYVDDVQVFNSTEQSIVECFSLIKQLEKSSGAIVHKGKTTGLYMYIGHWKDKTPEFNKIKWTKPHVKTLGIVHGYDIDENTIWMEKINKIKSCIQVWKKCDLTIKGRILIIKVLLVSQIGFEVEMQSIPKHILKTTEDLIWQFLWNDKKSFS